MSVDSESVTETFSAAAAAIAFRSSTRPVGFTGSESGPGLVQKGRRPFSEAFTFVG